MAIVRNCHTGHVMFGVEIGRPGLTPESIGRARIFAVNFHSHFAPPWMIAAFMWADVQLERICGGITGKLHSQKLAALVCHGFSVVLIESALAIATRVYAQRKWSIGNFIRALGQRLHGHNGAFADENWQNFRRGMYQGLHRGSRRSSLLMQTFTAPIVVPISRWKFHRIRIWFFWEWRRRDQQVGAEQKFVSRVEIERMLVRGSIRKFIKQWTHVRQPSSLLFFNICV